MEKKKKPNHLFLKSGQENRTVSLIVFLVLRFLVVLCMVLQIIRGDVSNALLCAVSFILLLVPSMIQRKLDITLPNTLEVLIYLFIFSAEILGEIRNFYEIFPYWDMILHTLNGFLSAAVGFSLIDLLNKKSKKFKLSPLYLCIVSFCFSMTIGVCWEFFEYGADRLFLKDMQKDVIVSKISTVSLDPEKKNQEVIISGIDSTVLYDKDGVRLATIKNGYLDIGIYDTMGDLFVNFIGAFTFSFFGYFYLKNKGTSHKFIDYFIPIKGKRKFSKRRGISKKNI